MLIPLNERCFVSAPDILQIHAPGDGSVAVHMRDGAVHQIDAGRSGTHSTVARLAQEVNAALARGGLKS